MGRRASSSSSKMDTVASPRSRGGRANLCFLTTAATLQAARRPLAPSRSDHAVESAARKRLENAEIDGQWIGTGPVTYGNQRRVPGVLAIGDAAGFIDPFTGSGIQLALTGGELAAEIVDEGLQSGIGVKAIIERYRRIQRSRIDWRFRACSMLRRWSFSLRSTHYSRQRLLVTLRWPE